MLLWLLVVQLIDYAFSNSIVFDVEPSNVENHSAGSTVKLSCEVPDPKAFIIWHKDNTEIGEGCKFYDDKFNHIKCLRSGDKFVLTIRDIGPKSSGIWQCSYLLAKKSLQIRVFVPPILKKPEISTLDLKSDEASPVSALKSTYKRTSTNFHNEDDGKPSQTNFFTGTKYDPIDLRRDSSKIISIKCSTTCASEKPELNWLAINSTTNIDLASGEFGSTGKEESCSDGLQSVSETVTLSCADPYGGVGVAVRPTLNRHLELIGLNRISCSIGRQRSISIDPNHSCDMNGQAQTACQYILCYGECTSTGPPRDSLFTMGEKIALGVAIAFLILLVVMFCHLSRQERLITSSKSHLMNYQGNEVELML